MMGIRGNRQLSRGIVDFVTTCEELVPPHLIKTIIQAIPNSLQAPNPVATFNRAIGQICRHAPQNAWPQAQAWVFQPHVVTLFSSRGTLWALLIWRDALSKLELGSKANVAFGMDKPGNPPKKKFTTYMDAAMYWQLLVQEGKASPSALNIALTINNDPGGNPLSEPDVRKAKAHLPKLDSIDVEMIKLLKSGIENKYGLAAKGGD
ncbi:MAG: hypothetical protein HOO19_16435 [Rhodospirillaceae bacterium]|jgi:hypothetical protein|nr:hypothetical protein [Rhodospirillaceae bacterium]MBT4750925.1 hypothetical protein [Rhodospirillaceae bacterium]MBT5178161.1 hypothetical protein [Rhodospirillaceae bacterium]MBT7232245.1 hypothetical protein [Rhodospirillaceae bacterium]MBT7571975.1 hypothetical protein [Rhodospirillaceae bacterium]